MFKSIQAKVNAIITVVLVLVFLFFSFFLDEKLRENAWQQKIKQAQLLYQQLSFLKTYIGKHRGIWIKNPKGDDFILKEGNFGRKNTSIVLGDLSEQAVGNDMYNFKVVSPNPIKKRNKADAFETQALMQFKTKGTDTEIYKIDKKDKVLRYIKPMVTKEFCIKCHPEYTVGDINGGISITIPIQDTLKEIRSSRIYFGIFGISTLIIVLVSLILILSNIVTKPIKQLTDRAEKISTGDISISTATEREDEIGALSNAIERLRISIKKLMK
ncbi:MAG TPA: hypothetical protein DHM44_01005 [Flexistipes sinusarabici]|uniref:histidine kinase n=1 Tax=Flexistipes sinusarabici TaxID=2352 RepID=A0A3D5QAQ0_FLESI|nr:hypothetical protein [Flexistipes sinusarabici]